MTERLLTTAETCNQLRVSRMTLWRLTQAGHVTPIRISARANRYRQTEIDAYLEQQPDDAATIAQALALISQQHEEDKRPLCPECGKRRITRGAAFCKWCLQQRDAELLDKITWWEKHGNDWRNQRRQETTDA
ncbi:helix-turn-helix domain-containing protein [Acidiferrimicrobium sp. IK]|uniref:helix-turn-helix transcriptional regulator n=1 Tax=Acidiferrimicrobium sp. IK TaxID=2871700 RepID=UPI0021CB3694|nr:helix-turn-helix domain-containing protein [Acidiferrimicrobium sp. IK]MCU4184011.1 helix-turn-helix domain-containing protein [Acidiferrimicrobium sp. IK]